MHGAPSRHDAAFRPKILLVDDEPLILRLMERTLNDAGFDCACCCSGNEGLEALARRHFHAVVTDVGMPGMSGIDLLRSARRLAPDLPLILVSGDSSEATLAQAKRFGAYGYLRKPLEIAELVTLLRRAVDQGGARSGDRASHTVVRDT